MRVKLAAGSPHLGQKQQPELPVAVLTCLTCIYSVGILVLTDLSSDLMGVLQGQIFVCMNYSKTLVHYMQSLFSIANKFSVFSWCWAGVNMVPLITKSKDLPHNIL